MLGHILAKCNLMILSSLPERERERERERETDRQTHRQRERRRGIQTGIHRQTDNQILMETEKTD